jgi:hypothetical protein
VASLLVDKIILIQYPRYSLFDSDEARRIRDAANRHGIRVFDIYNSLKHKPLLEILKHGNEIVADWAAEKIPAITP